MWGGLYSLHYKGGKIGRLYFGSDKSWKELKRAVTPGCELRNATIPSHSICALRALRLSEAPNHQTGEASVLHVR